MASINQACNCMTPSQNGVELQKALESIRADLAAINAWQGTLATKLNADAGVTDTNYAAPASLGTTA